MKLASDYLIVSVDDARIIMKALTLDLTADRIRRLDSLGLLEIINELRDAIRRSDDE